MPAPTASPDAADRPLFEVWPDLDAPFAALGDFPTPVERVSDAIWVKRDDLSSPLYGGNKVRTLEALFGAAKRAGATRVYSTGAFGSNHATATVMHAPRVGLEPGILLFPQPRSFAALENLRVMLKARPVVRTLPHWSFLPFGMAWARRRDLREGARPELMVPGGATPVGALGYVSAGLELARQVADGALPCPRAVVVGVGSTCTSAGLLLGMWIASELGLGWREAPRLVSVRVTPWPVTSPLRIVSLARRTAALLSARTGEARWERVSRKQLGERLEVDGRYLGRGYGLPTRAGLEAIARWQEDAGFPLDTTYTAKTVACLYDRARDEPGPLLYWSTKSTAPLPEVAEDDWRWAPRPMTRWIERAERELAGASGEPV